MQSVYILVRTIFQGGSPRPGKRDWIHTFHCAAAGGGAVAGGAAGGGAAGGASEAAQSAHAGLQAPRKSSRQLTPEISRQYGQMQMTLSQSSLHVHARASLPTHRTHSGWVQQFRCVIVEQHSSRGQNRVAQMLHSSGGSLDVLLARLIGRLNSSVTASPDALPALALGRYIIVVPPTIN